MTLRSKIIDQLFIADEYLHEDMTREEIESLDDDSLLAMYEESLFYSFMDLQDKVEEIMYVEMPSSALH